MTLYLLYLFLTTTMLLLLLLLLFCRARDYLKDEAARLNMNVGDEV